MNLLVVLQLRGIQYPVWGINIVELRAVSAHQSHEWMSFYSLPNVPHLLLQVRGPYIPNCAGTTSNTIPLLSFVNAFRLRQFGQQPELLGSG